MNVEHPEKTFTVDEANATLPLVRAIASDLASLSRDVIERRQRLAHLLTGRDLDPSDPYGEELAQIKQQVDQDTERLKGFVNELRDLGVEPKSGPEGLVDFPSMMDGRLVYLCWKLGEQEVEFWHEIDAGFRGRQSLISASASKDVSSGGDESL